MSHVVLATGGYDSCVKLWEASTGTCTANLPCGDKQVNCIDITPDKRHVAAGSNPKIFLFEIGSSKREPVLTCEGHKGNVTAIGFQKDCKWMYTGSSDKSVKIWDLRSPKASLSFDCPAAVNSVKLHPNQGELITADDAGCVRVWDLTASRCTMELIPDGSTPLRSVSIACDASMVVAANNHGRTYFWSPVSSSQYTPVRKLAAHRGYVLNCTISPDVRLLATTGSDNTVKLWGMSDGKLVQTLCGHSKWVWDCVFSADSSYLATASSDSTAQLWELGTGDAVRSYSAHTKGIVSVALHDAPEVREGDPAPPTLGGKEGGSGSGGGSGGGRGADTEESQGPA
jgi:G protein beta subunit-like protein